MSLSVIYTATSALTTFYGRYWCWLWRYLVCWSSTHGQRATQRIAVICANTTARWLHVKQLASKHPKQYLYYTIRHKQVRRPLCHNSRPGHTLPENTISTRMRKAATLVCRLLYCKIYIIMTQLFVRNAQWNFHVIRIHIAGNWPIFLKCLGLKLHTSRPAWCVAGWQKITKSLATPANTTMRACSV